MRRKARIRAISLLAAGVLVGTMITAMPATADVGGTLAQLVDHLKSYFYTKGEANSRFTNIGEGVARSTRVSSTDSIALPVGTTTMESLSLPAGRYLIEGRAVIQDSSATDHMVRCDVSPSTTHQDVSRFVAADTEGTINISEVVSLSSATAVDFSCISFDTPSTAYRVVLIGIPIQGIVVQ
jgi:hypothetical protein